MKNLDQIIVSPDSTIRETLVAIDNGLMGVALVTDENLMLLGTVTDGDIRRALIKDATLNDSIETIMTRDFIKAHKDISRNDLIALMQHEGITQIPLVNNYGKLIDIKKIVELLPQNHKENKLLIMAGGLGTRLQPFTNTTPKPLLPIGNKPILESIIEHAKTHGLRDILISLNYLSESIKNYIGDGSKMGVNITYIDEKESLGTAGSISLIEEEIKEDLFVINGDILTKVNFDDMLKFHQQKGNTLTVGTRPYKTQVPYGIIKEKDNEILEIEEKPILQYTINAGIYILSPEIIKLIPKNTHFHMTHLMEILFNKKRKVGSFLIDDYWLDIGKINDYYKANIDFYDFFE